MQMLMDLGPVVYVEDFEKHFLAKASEFYQVIPEQGCTRCAHIIGQPYPAMKPSESCAQRP